MARNDDTSALIDTIIRISAGGVFITAGFLAPQILQLLDKPTHKLFDKLDERELERKIRNSIRYMQRQGLLAGSYEHGLIFTKKALKRLNKVDFDSLKINIPEAWDRQWRLVLFDIPEKNRDRRIALTTKIKHLGFQPLQQSIWIHPFACKEEITTVCSKYGVEQWVTYIETNHIDHEEKLVQRFNHLL